MTASPRAATARRALRLEWITIAWNAAEVVVTVGLGLAAGSLALVAFGLDSLIEIWASLVVVWHLGDGESPATAARSVRALRLVAAAFFALGAFLVVAAIVRLAGGVQPDDSPVAVAYLAATVVVMLVLAAAKRRAGAALGDHPLAAEARMTLLDAGLAAGILVALVANIAAGWWWADSAAALVVGVLAALEGRENRELADDLRSRALRPSG